MLHASDNIYKGTHGFVIHNDIIHSVIVSSVEDISYHGSSCYVIRFKEIPNTTFFKMYETFEHDKAREDLATSLQKKVDSLKEQRKSLKSQIKALKSTIISLGH